MALTANCGCDCGGSVCNLPRIRVKFSGFLAGSSNCARINTGNIDLDSAAPAGTGDYYWLSYYGGREWRGKRFSEKLLVKVLLPVGGIAQIYVYPIGSLDAYATYVLFEESAPGLRDWAVVASANPTGVCGNFSGVAVDDWIEVDGEGCCTDYCAIPMGVGIFTGFSNVNIAGVTGADSAFANGDWTVGNDPYSPPETGYDGYGCYNFAYVCESRDGIPNNDLTVSFGSRTAADYNGDICGGLSIFHSGVLKLRWIMYKASYPVWTLDLETPGSMEGGAATITLTPAL